MPNSVVGVSQNAALACELITPLFLSIFDTNMRRKTTRWIMIMMVPGICYGSIFLAKERKRLYFFQARNAGNVVFVEQKYPNHSLK